MKLSQLRKKLLDRTRWHSRVILDIIRRRIYKFPIVLSTSESIEIAEQKRLSIARFGDGELMLMCGRNLNFQKYDSRLASKMEHVLSSQSPQLLVCIPDCFNQNTLASLCKVDADFWHTHLMWFRREWYKRLRKNQRYGNTWLSRIYSMKWDVDEAHNTFRKLESLWCGRDVIIIEGAYSRLGVGNTCFAQARTIRRIIGPARDSFKRYDDIMAEALKADKDALFILAMGPTATAMAGELSEQGRQAIDIGHLDVEYEWLRMKANKKIPIRGKFVNEAFLTGLSKTEVIGDLSPEEWQTYQTQIIADFSL